MVDAVRWIVGRELYGSMRRGRVAELDVKLWWFPLVLSW